MNGIPESRIGLVTDTLVESCFSGKSTSRCVLFSGILDARLILDRGADEVDPGAVKPTNAWLPRRKAALGRARAMSRRVSERWSSSSARSIRPRASPGR